MARLYLIKHSLPEIDPARPPREWGLGEAGRALAARLAARLRDAGISRFVTSDEPKARATGEVMAAELGVPVEVAEGLHEQDRAGTPFLASRADFEAAVGELFARPGERVFGPESAAEAEARFATALGGVLARAGQGPIAVVAHGTVMALFIAERSRLDGFALWRSLGLPSCAVLSLPDLRLVELVDGASPAP